MKIAAIILAAGESKRMKSPKMILPFKGRTMIECVIGNIQAAGIDEPIIVVGAWKEDIEKVAGNHRVKIVFNRNYRNGMLSSIRCGINSVPPSCDAAVIIPGDMPMVSADVINKVINDYIATGKRIVIPVYQGRRGHPLLVASDLFREINRLDENEGLRQLAQVYPEDVIEAEVDSDSILKDIDTRTEYLKEINSN